MRTSICKENIVRRCIHSCDLRLLRILNLQKKIHNIQRNIKYMNQKNIRKNNMDITYLTQDLAQKIDNELMSDEIGYSVDQLMELVGLSISEIIFKEYPISKFKNILIISGPGNNGGDGLVSARHLKTYGYNVHVVYSKPNQKPLFKRLINLLKHYNIEVYNDIQIEDLNKYDLIVDAIFGFNFHGEPKSPFDKYIKIINESKKPIVSIDVPSGLNINSNLTSNLYVNSNMNISLMLPKEGIKNYKNKHYLSGRFIPNSIVEKYNLKIPTFPGDSSFVLL